MNDTDQITNELFLTQSKFIHSFNIFQQLHYINIIHSWGFILIKKKNYLRMKEV